MSLLPIMISTVAVAMELLVGLLCLGFATAPGWRALRWFAAIALTAAAYSFCNLAFVLPVPEAVVLWAGRLNVLWASAHVAAWLAYSRVQAGERMARWERITGAVLVGLGLVALVPGVVMEPGRVVVQELPRLGIAYRVPVPAPFGDLFMVAIFGVMTVPVVRYVRRARAGVPGALAHSVGFGIFFLAAGLELATSLRLAKLPYLGDLGFLAVVLVVSGEMVHRVVRNARLLTALTENLESEVEERTGELLTAREALVQTERHAALGQLAAGIGHEINNPLTYVVANLEELHDTLETGEPRQWVDEALEGAHRIARVVRQLKLFARPTEEERQPVDVGDTLDAALQLVQHDLRHRARVRRELGRVRPVLADGSKLGQIFVNLLVNAAQAIRDGHPERNAVTVRTYEQDGSVVAEISDTGKGIDPGDLPRIFDPYFTTKPISKGTGLGLSIVKGLVESQGGSIEAESQPGRGATFRVRLPAYTGTRPVRRSPLPERRARRMSRRTNRPRRRVLIVDDEPLVARALRRNLRHMQVDLAASGREALATLDRDDAYDAIVCDLMMPDMSGMELYEQLLRTRPELARRMIFITGGTVTERARRFLERDDIPWLPKPVDTSALRRMLGSLTSEPTGEPNGTADSDPVHPGRDQRNPDSPPAPK